MNPEKYGWPTVSLHELCDISIGRTPSRRNKRYWGPGKPWATISDMNGCEQIQTTKEQITDAAIAECGCKEVPTGTLLMSFKLSIGKLAFAGIPIFTNEAIAALPIRDQKRVDSRFLFYALQTMDFTGSSDRAAKGKTLNKKKLRDLRVPLPDKLTDQQHIAAILDKADAIRRKRAEAIRLADDFLESVFVDWFGDPYSNPNHWDVCCLDEVCDSKGQYGSGASAVPYDGKVRYIRITDITDQGRLNNDLMSANLSIDDHQKYALHDGDVLFARSGATVGKSLLYRSSMGNAVFAGYLIRFVPDPSRLLPEFLFQLTRTQFYRSWVASKQRVVAQPNINAKQYGQDFKFPLPPIDKQREFVKASRKVVEALGKQDVYLGESGRLFESLSQQAFSGRLA